MSMYDIAIVGGGINGVGIAADAASRGLKVFLCEQNDLASGTSSASTKLIHGGLRYLEHYEFSMVRKALIERDRLRHIAPHLIHPMRFVIPYQANMRPKWMMRIGMFLYDHLYIKNSLMASEMIAFNQHRYGKPLSHTHGQGFIYSDCWTDDARLVVLNAIAAKKQGAHIATRTKLLDAERLADRWRLHLSHHEPIEATCLVNASGPWLDDILANKLHVSQKPTLHLVKGSHIIMPKLYRGEQAYVLPSDDSRIIFAIPFEKKFTLVGTTELQLASMSHEMMVTSEEEQYLLNVINQYFVKQVTSQDIVYRFAGCRPLLASENKSLSALSRDYQLQLDTPEQQAPLLNIVGGKLTTYRILAEQAVDKLKPIFKQLPSSKTASTLLPGALPLHDYQKYMRTFKKKYDWLPIYDQYRFLQSYGTLAEGFLDGKNHVQQLGKHFGHGLYQAEVDYLMQQEWAQEPMDILWRRSKLILYLNTKEQQELESYMKQ